MKSNGSYANPPQTYNGFARCFFCVATQIDSKFWLGFAWPQNMWHISPQMLSTYFAVLVSKWNINKLVNSQIQARLYAYTYTPILVCVCVTRNVCGATANGKVFLLTLALTLDTFARFCLRSEPMANDLFYTVSHVKCVHYSYKQEKPHEGLGQMALKSGIKIIKRFILNGRTKKKGKPQYK